MFKIKKWPKITRDLTLFLVGLIGILNETFLVAEPRAELLILFGGMVGLPAFLNVDQQTKKTKP